MSAPRRTRASRDSGALVEAACRTGMLEADGLNLALASSAGKAWSQCESALATYACGGPRRSSLPVCLRTSANCVTPTPSLLLTGVRRGPKC
jgi:hypothetical protein